MKRIALLFTMIVVAILAAQASKVNENPHDVIYNHLFYLQEGNYQPSEAAKSFDLEAGEAANRKAVRLKQILDGKGLFVDLENIPKTADFFDSTHEAHVFYIDPLIPSIYVEKQGEEWFYSDETAEAIPELFQKTFPFGSQWSTYFHAPFWSNQILGLKLMHWTELLISLLIAIFLVYILQRLLKPLFSRLTRLNLGILTDADSILMKLSRVVALLVATKLVQFIVPSFMLPAQLNSFLIKGLSILSVFFLIFIVLQLLELFFSYMKRRAEATEGTMDDQLVPILRRIGQIIVWMLGLLLVLRILKVDITALVAGISIGGLAIALAAQDTVKNFFGSVMIFIDRPFQIGDWIHFNDVDGIVEEVGIRATRIRTFANSITYVPNGMLANQVVDNMGLRTYRRYKADIGVTYDTPPDTIDAFVDGIKEIIKMHPTARKDYFEVHLNSFGAYSLNILVYMFFEAPDWTAELSGRHDVMQAIIRLADSMGVRFAFPTQSLQIEEFPGKMSGIPSHKKEGDMITSRDKTLEAIRKRFEMIHKEDSGKYKPIGGS